MKRFILLFVIFTVFQTSAQTGLSEEQLHRLDSLRTSWKNTSLSDSIRGASLQKLISDFNAIKITDSSFYYANQLLEFAKLKEFNGYEMFAYGTLGFEFSRKNMIDNARENFSNGLKIAKETSNLAWIRFLSSNLYFIDNSRGNYLMAIDHLFTELETYDPDKERLSIAEILINIGLCYENLEDHTSALDYFDQGLKIGVEMADDNVIGQSYYRIGTVYTFLKNEEAARDNYLKASPYLKKSSNSILFYNLVSLGETYDRLGQESLMRKALKEALGVSNQSELQQIADRIQLKKSVAHRLLGEYDKALNLAKEGLKNAQEVNSDQDIAYASLAMYQVYKDLGQMNKALEAYERFNDLTDTIRKRENLSEAIRKEYQIEYTKKAAIDSTQAAEQQQNVEDRMAVQELQLANTSMQRYIFLGALLIALVLGWYFYNRFRKSRQQKLIEESRALRAQMNPHFVSNALSGIQGIMLEEGEEHANKYFGYFSKMLRLTLTMSNSEYISLGDEVAYLRAYLELEKIRLNHDLTINFEIDDNLSLTAHSIPCMIFQPIVENAIIHGLKPKKDDRSITISFNKEGELLVGEVMDNGIGRAASAKNKKDPERESWATKIINNRIALSNQLHRQKIDITIEDLIEQNQAQGTKVTLRIPLKDHISLSA